MKNKILLNQDYIFCFEVVMSLLPFASPEKFYSRQMMDLHKEMFQLMKNTGIIDSKETFQPYVLTEELYIETLNSLMVKIPKSSSNKETYRKKLNDLLSLSSKSDINNVIKYFSEERVKLDKILYSLE